MVTAPTATCVNHRRRNKVAACGTCGNALCGDCIVHTPVGVKCRSCTGTQVPAGSVRAEAAAGARRRPWAVLLVAGGLLVLAGAAYGLLSRNSEPAATGDGAEVELGAPFVERHSTFVGPGGQSLGGTLTLPGAGDGKDVPAVLIVPGLGAIDRNAVTPAATADAGRDALAASVAGLGVGAGDPLYRDLSETLARAGIASFRYDKRGTTASPLDPGQRLSFDDEVADARAALTLLADRQEVGNAPLAVLGHDTGGLVALRLAAAHSRVRAVVAVSTPGRPLADVIADDLARARGPGVADGWRAAAAALSASGTAPPAETVPELLRPVFAAGHDAYLRTILGLDPAKEAAAVSVPVLIVRGGADRSVTTADTDRLAAALREGQVVAGSSESNHNLSLGTAGHEHSNTVRGPASTYDADTGSKLTTWVKTRLSG